MPPPAAASAARRRGTGWSLIPVNAPLKTHRRRAGGPTLRVGRPRGPFEAGDCPRARPALLPGLEHQDAPDQAAPVARPAQVLLPLATDRRGVQEPFFSQAAFVEQSLGPIAQRPPQPAGERDAEALLG